MKYRKKPVVVEAVQFKYFNDLGKWKMAYPVEGVRGAETFLEKLSDWWRGYPRYYVDTLEGTLFVREGDYIIKGVKGEFYPCKPSIFEMTYEPVGED